MGKNTPKNKEDLRFIRLRYSNEDLVGYVTYGEEYITIELPLRIDIETLFDESRQILSLQEYLPQAVIELQEIQIPMEEILFVTPVREEFYDQYDYVSDFFYNNNAKLKSMTKTKEDVNKEMMEKTQKVVSILEALQSKKDKPIH